MDLFVEKQTASVRKHTPLADRMRPHNLSHFIGQNHLVGPKKILRKIIEDDNPVSLIFWGPPGTGKTTLARIIANETQAVFYAISAVTAGVKDVRKVIDQAKVNQRGLGKRSILFIDEIHRFNKGQQDALLHSVEDGTLILIGATTENPSFEVISPLLSRCRVLKLDTLTEEEIESIINRAFSEDQLLKESCIELSDEVKGYLVRLSDGDARIALNALELCTQLAPEKNGKRVVTIEIVQEAMQKRTLFYDKQGDLHYDTISAFIKSVRGSDPDAAIYWMARMLESGEDPLFIARRLIILASEDIGNADPQGLVIANAAFQAVHAVGMPEARIILSQAATYLASAPKSNAAYVAISEAGEEVRSAPPEVVPLHLRNPVTKIMKEMDYGKGYQYAHNSDDGFVEQVHLPDRLKDRIYYRPKEIGEEKMIKKRLESWWKKRRKADK
jgi:putative ATPase